jgi:magnesium transporter
MAITAYYLTPEKTLRTGLAGSEIKDAFESNTGLLWADIEGESEQELEILETTFHFHPLAIEDCKASGIHPPKVDDFDGYIFLIIHGIHYGEETDIVQTSQVEMFIGKHFVVSHHDFPVLSNREIMRLIENGGRPLSRGADFLAHEIADALIDNVLPTIDIMSDVADDIEDEAINNPRKETIEAILKLKRSMIRIRRVMTPQREIFNRLSRREYGIISEDALIYFRDIYDHLVRIDDMNQAIRDRVDNSLSTYLSSIANRQNETMRVLSIVAAIFMPLTLLAGIYGMNFEYMPELTWRWGYFAVLGLMAVALIGITWWLWLKNIFGRRKVTFIRPLKVDRKILLGHIERVAKENLNSWRL